MRGRRGKKGKERKIKSEGESKVERRQDKEKSIGISAVKKLEEKKEKTVGDTCLMVRIKIQKHV